MDLPHEQRLTEVEERSKSNTKRIDKLEKTTEAIHKLATSMEVMVVKQKEVAETVGKLNKKVTVLETKPAKRWEFIVEKAIGFLVAAIVGFLLAKIGL